MTNLVTMPTTNGAELLTFSLKDVVLVGHVSENTKEVWMTLSNGSEISVVLPDEEMWNRIREALESR